MLKLRPFKNCDAKKIVSWCKDEKSFRQWCSDRFENFPISEDDIIKKYVENNGDCPEEDNFFSMTAFLRNTLFAFDYKKKRRANPQ